MQMFHKSYAAAQAPFFPCLLVSYSFANILDLFKELWRLAKDKISVKSEFVNTQGIWSMTYTLSMWSHHNLNTNVVYYAREIVKGQFPPYCATCNMR